MRRSWGEGDGRTGRCRLGESVEREILESSWPEDELRMYRMGRQVSGVGYSTVKYVDELEYLGVPGNENLG